MARTFDNPLGTDGFEFVEFTSPQPEEVGRLFRQFGFAEVARHRHKAVSLYQQGDINFILNREPNSQAAGFAHYHGPSCNAMAFRVKDAARAYQEALGRGAFPIDQPVGPMELRIPAIAGVGGLVIYLVDRYGARTIYDVDFEPLASAGGQSGVGLTRIDHLTHNLQRGHLAQWADFYQRVFNFREIRHFDIEGQLTGLISSAMTSPCGKIRIPLNESRDDKSQIEEFLARYHGEGIQHIALATDDIHATVEALARRGVPFQQNPAAYYEAVDQRLPGHGEDLARLRANGILVDGNPAAGGGLLLQIFTRDMIGPIFFEIIQRKGDEGFGEGNFRALFEAIERDQIRRGVLS
ncbi:MAG: 4-hydroxyphenylpyruvate dioxygenase [Rhodocyclaceae bacterium]|jgi:4-hydroxyphenylpyruvate dioxygenase|nr:4-hydroxyphenylpyruvate dioxygenase [Rhodocyclaceae bacterium]